MGRYDPLVLWLALLSCALNLTFTTCGFIPSHANTGFIGQRQTNFQRGISNLRGNNFERGNFVGFSNGQYPMNFGPNTFQRALGAQRGVNNFARGLRPQHSYSRLQPGGSHGYSRRHIRAVTSSDVIHKRVRRQATSSGHGSQHMKWNFHPDNIRRPVPQGAPGQGRNSPKVIIDANGNPAGQPSVVAAGQVRPSIVKLPSRTNIDPPYQVNNPQQILSANSGASPIRQKTSQLADRTGLTKNAPLKAHANILNTPNMGASTNFLLDNFFPQMQPELLGLNNNPLLNSVSTGKETGNIQNSIPNHPVHNQGSKSPGTNQDTRIVNKNALMAGNNRIVMNASRRILDNTVGRSVGNGIHELHQQILPGNEQNLQGVPSHKNGASLFSNIQSDRMGVIGQGSGLINPETMKDVLPNGRSSSSGTVSNKGQNKVAQQLGRSHQHLLGHGSLHSSPNLSGTRTGGVNGNLHGNSGKLHDLGIHPQSRINLHRGSSRIMKAPIPKVVSRAQIHNKHAGSAGTASLQNSKINSATNLGHATHKAMANQQVMNNAKLAEPLINNVQNRIPFMNAARSIKAQSPALGILPPKQTSNIQRLSPNVQHTQTKINQIMPGLQQKPTERDQRTLQDLPPKQLLTNQRLIPNLPPTQTQTNKMLNPQLHLNHMGDVSGLHSGQGSTSNMNLSPSGLEHMGLVNNQILTHGVNQGDVFQQIQGLTIKDLAKSNFTKDQILNALANNFKTRDDTRHSTNKDAVKQNLGNGLVEMATDPSVRNVAHNLNGAAVMSNIENNDIIGSEISLGPGVEPSVSLTDLELSPLPDLTKNGMPAHHDLNNPAEAQNFDRTNLIADNSKAFQRNVQTGREMSRPMTQTRSGVRLSGTSNHLKTNFRPNIRKNSLIRHNNIKSELRQNNENHVNINPQERHAVSQTENVNSLSDASTIDNISPQRHNIPVDINRMHNNAPGIHTNIPSNTLMSDGAGHHNMNIHGGSGGGNQALRTNKGAGMIDVIPVQQMNLPKNADLRNTAPFQQNIKRSRSKKRRLNAPNNPGSKPELPGGVRVEHWLFSEMGKIMSSKAVTTTSTTTTPLPATTSTGRPIITQQPNIPAPTAEQIASRNGRRPSRKFRPRGRRRRKKIRRRINRGRSRIISTSTTHVPIISRGRNRSIFTDTTHAPTIIRGRDRSVFTDTTHAPTIIRGRDRSIFTDTTHMPTITRGRNRSSFMGTTHVPRSNRGRSQSFFRNTTPGPRFNGVRSRRLKTSTTLAPRVVKASVDTINSTNTANSKQDSRLKRRKINITKETRIVTRPIGPPVNPQTNLLLSQIVKELKKSATTPSPLNQDINHKLSQILDLLKSNSNPTSNPFGIVPTTAPSVDILQLLGGAPSMPQEGGAALGVSSLLNLGNGDASNPGQQNQMNPLEMLLMGNILNGNGAPGQASSLTQLLTGMGSGGQASLGQNGTTPEQNMNSTLIQAMVQHMMLNNNDNNNNGCGCYPKALGCPNELFPRNGRRWKHLIQCKKDETRCCDDN